MRDRLGRILAALGAAVALAALVVGVPIVLSTAAGWPLPTAIPSWTSVRTALTGASIPDEVIVKTIAVIAWLAWTQIVVSAVVEVSAWIRGRVAPSIPLAGPIQLVVRQLVLAVLIVGSSSRVTPVPVVARQPVAIAYEPLTLSEQVPPATAEQRAPAPQRVDLRYTVVPRDSLWKLAELHLGDGLRWRELWELNRGVPQSDGRCLTDPDLIRPGWVLRFPQDAVGLAPVETPATAEPAATPASPPPPVAQPSAPAPVVTAPATAAPQVPTTAGTTSAPAGERSGDEAARERNHDDGGILAPIGLAGAGLLAAGLVTTLNRLRRAQVRRRTPGRAIATCPVAEDAERRLRSAADLDGASRLDIALAVLGAAARPHSGAAIEAVLAGDDIEVLFTERVGGDPHLFTVDAGGRAWTLPAQVTEEQLVASAQGRVTPVPGLVPLGRIDDRTLLIDLEAMPVTVVSGPEETVDSVLWEAAASLTTSVWSDDVRVLLLGHQVPGFERLDRAEVVDPEVVVAAVEADLLATRAELAAHRMTTLLDARVSDGSWTTTVVIAGRSAPTDVVQSLADLAADGAGLVVLTAVDVASAQRRVTVDGAMVMVSPPGIAAQRAEVSAEEREQVGALIHVALPGSAEEEPPLLAPVPEVERAAAETSATASHPLLVRVLGRVEIDGAALDRRLAEELTVYLALHPDGADEQRLKTVLWPEGPPSPHAFNQAVSRTRTALGTAPDGTHYLPRLVAREQYRLSALVTSDLAIIESALRTALADENATTIEALADALRLVRGEPFEGVRAGYAWAHSEGFASRAEILAADAAHVVANWHIEHGEATAALWAVGQGLLAAPADEALYRDRMRVYALSGNLTGIESAMKELCRIADAQEPYDSLHPETVELYNTLTRRRVG